MKEGLILKRIGLVILLTTTATMLGFFTTFQHVEARGLEYLEQGEQIQRHQAILEGRAGNPWQYRILAPYMLNPILKFLENLELPYHTAMSFILFRVIQDASIFVIFYAYQRKLGLSLLHSLCGMALLAWAMSYSHYDSDLQFSTFFDVIFYLLAGLSIIEKKYIWIIPITFLAALNRETSGLIPFLLLPNALFVLPGRSMQKMLSVFFIASLIFGIVFVGLRMYYPSQELLLPYGHKPGLDLLKYNLFNLVTWLQLIATFNIIPIIAIAGYKKWPYQLRLFFWVIVPLWFLIHAFGAVMAETRLFLVPIALVFIPSALLALAHQTQIGGHTFKLNEQI